MPRTAIPITKLVKNGAAAEVAGTALDQPNGHTVKAKRPGRIVIQMTNTDAAPHNVTIKGGAYPPALSSSDLVVPVTNGQRVNIGPLEGAQFAQADGSINIDLAAGMAGSVWVYELPR